MDVRGEIESLRRSPNEKERAKEKKVEAISKLERKPVDAWRLLQFHRCFYPGAGEGVAKFAANSN